jgi:hypothetical protein
MKKFTAVIGEVGLTNAHLNQEAFEPEASANVHVSVHTVLDAFDY